MKDKELRKLIGSRAKQRRTELNLTQPYIAEKMGVTASTIQRYEAGTIDNTKKMVLEGLSEALHVSVEWLRGETDEYETDITDKRELQIRDAMTDIIKEVSESGTTVLLVEQNAKKALSIADRAYVLETGSITLEGKADDLLHDESVQKAYLGE